MFYFFIFIVSILIFSKSNKLIVGNNRYLLLFTILLLVIGFQYQVGTDYDSYINLINNGNIIKNKNEFLFYYILEFVRVIHLDNQSLFIIVSFLQLLFTFIFFKKLENKGIEILIIIILYFTVSGVFFNQMNILRQYIALPIISIGILYLEEKKYIKFILFIIFAMLFHSSAIILLPLLFFLYIFKKNYSSRFYILYIAITLVISFVGIKDILVFLISKLSPIYAHYLDSSFSENASLTSIIMKYLTLPLYIYSIMYLNDINNNFNRFLYNIGIFSISLFYLFSEVSILLRVALYFNFFKIFPLYFLIKSSLNRKQYWESICIFLYIIGLFVVKVVFFPVGEYLYSNIIFEKSFYY